MELRWIAKLFLPFPSRLYLQSGHRYSKKLFGISASHQKFREASYTNFLAICRAKSLCTHPLRVLAPHPTSQPAVLDENWRAIGSAMLMSRESTSHCDSIASLNKQTQSIIQIYLPKGSFAEWIKWRSKNECLSMWRARLQVMLEWRASAVTINDCVRPQKSFPFCLDRREIKKSASADGDKEPNGETRRNLNANVVSRSE